MPLNSREIQELRLWLKLTGTVSLHRSNGHYTAAAQT